MYSQYVSDCVIPEGWPDPYAGMNLGLVQRFRYDGQLHPYGGPGTGEPTIFEIEDPVVTSPYDIPLYAGFRRTYDPTGLGQVDQDSGSKMNKGYDWEMETEAVGNPTNLPNFNPIFPAPKHKNSDKGLYVIIGLGIGYYLYKKYL